MLKNQSGLTPTGDKVLVCPPVVSLTTRGGIIELPEHVRITEHNAQQVATLIAMGPEAEVSPELDGINPGDLVVFPRYQQAEFTMNGIVYWYLRANAILGKAEFMPDPKFNGAESSLVVFGEDAVNA